VSENLKKQEQVQDQVIDDWDNLPLDPAMDDWDLPRKAVSSGGETDSEGDFSLKKPLELGQNIEENSLAHREGENTEQGPAQILEPSEQKLPDNNIVGEKEASQNELKQDEVRHDEESLDDDFDQSFEAPESVEIEELDLEESALEEEKSLAGDLGAGEKKEVVSPDLEPSAKKDSPAAKSGPDSTSSSSSKLPDAPPESDDLDPNRANFLKSLLDGNDLVPQKVELDLDGIFDGAKKEAETISPDATRTPVEAPKEEAARDEPNLAAVEPLAAPVVRKVPKFKLLLLIGILFLGVGGLGFGIYRIFFKSLPPNHNEAPLAVETDDLVENGEYEPGEVTLERFYINMDGGALTGVVELEIILHYRDKRDSQVIQSEIVLIRDMIYRLAKAAGADILSKTDSRRKLQRDLFGVLNNLASFKGDLDNPRITYVQISLLRRR